MSEATCAILDRPARVTHGRIEGMKLKRWHIWLGLVISAVFLYFALRGVDFKGVWQVLKEANFWWLLPGLLIYFLGVYLRAWRWQYLIKPIKKVPLRVLFPIINIGYMGNNVYPARAGEFLRAIVLKKREDISISASLATIVVERIFDAVVILAFVVLNLGQFSKAIASENLANTVQKLAVIAGIIFLLLLLIFVLIAMFPKTAKKAIDWVIAHIVIKRWRNGISNFAERFLDGLASLRSPKDALMILFTTILIWIFETGLYWSVMKAMGLSLSFPFLMLLNGVVNLVLLVPAAPGGLGTFDAACKAMLEAFGIGAELALGYTLVLRVVLWLPITILGAVYFLREGLRWNLDLKSLEGQAELEPDQDKPDKEI